MSFRMSKCDWICVSGIQYCSYNFILLLYQNYITKHYLHIKQFLEYLWKLLNFAEFYSIS